MRFVCNLATPADGQELLEVLEETVFPGNISLLYTRRPDAYQSFKQEGTDVDIVVCRDREQGRIAGVGACAFHRLFVNGAPENVGYLFGLRVRPEYRRAAPILFRGYRFLHQRQQAQGAPFALTTILTENRAAQALLEQPRATLPTYTPLGVYEVYALKTHRVARPSASARLNFRQAEASDVPRLIEFLQEQGCRSQFFPMLEAEDLTEGRISGLARHNFYLLYDAGQHILAAGALWDQRHYKQYIVQGYRGVLKLLYPLSRVFPLFGWPALPAPGKMLAFFTLSFWAVQGYDPELFSLLLDGVSVCARAYPFFLVGLPEQHPLRPVLHKRPHISYTSHLDLVYWDEQRPAVQRLERERVMYLECGML